MKIEMAEHEASRVPALSGRIETLLVVDDDPAARRLVVSMTRGLGYVVLEAADPKEAETVASRHPEPIDVLLTDVVMPGMHGPELADILAKSRPTMKIVLMAGRAEYRPQALSRALLEKPFTVQRLAETLRHVIECG